MEIRRTAIPEVVVFKPRVLLDERGWFAETFRADRFAEATGLDVAFVQDNQSQSIARGTVRGLHFQTAPHAQGKLVRVTRGAIYDVAVDIRPGSPTYGRHIAEVLSAENAAQLWIPPGFAHGFCTIERDSEVCYKTTAYYAADCDKGCRWDDPALGISWPVGGDAAVVSAKDQRQPLLAELPPYFTHRGGGAR